MVNSHGKLGGSSSLACKMAGTETWAEKPGVSMQPGTTEGQQPEQPCALPAVCPQPAQLTLHYHTTIHYLAKPISPLERRSVPLRKQAAIPCRGAHRHGNSSLEAEGRMHPAQPRWQPRHSCCPFPWVTGTFPIHSEGV